MAVFAKLTDGREVLLASAAGETPEDLVANMNVEALTGSAVAASDVMLKTADGGYVRFGAVVELRTKRA